MIAMAERAEKAEARVLELELDNAKLRERLLLRFPDDTADSVYNTQSEKCGNLCASCAALPEEDSPSECICHWCLIRHGSYAQRVMRKALFEIKDGHGPATEIAAEALKLAVYGQVPEVHRTETALSKHDRGCLCVECMAESDVRAAARALVREQDTHAGVRRVEGEGGRPFALVSFDAINRLSEALRGRGELARIARGEPTETGSAE